MRMAAPPRIGGARNENEDRFKGRRNADGGDRKAKKASGECPDWGVLHEVDGCASEEQGGERGVENSSAASGNGEIGNAVLKTLNMKSL